MLRQHLVVILLVLAHDCCAVLYQNATSLYSGAGSNFGTYIEGCTVDKGGKVYATNYLVAFDGTVLKDVDARGTLGMVTGSHPNTDANSATSLRADGTTKSSWNGARFAPTSIVPRHPGGGKTYKTALVTDVAAHKVVQVWLKPGASPVTRDFCGNADMAQPNDVVIASNGRVFVSGQRWTSNTVVGDGDLWTCSPTRTVGGSKAKLLATLGRTNGIELSPDEKTLYLSEAFNKNGNPVVNRVWKYDVNVAAGTVANRHLFVDFEKLDKSQGADVDGIRTDMAGNVYIARNGGWQVSVFSPAGKLLRSVRLTTKYPTSLEFGGSDGKTLYIVGRCGDAKFTTGVGCVDVYGSPAAGRAWTMLQQLA
eukprot:TRINITY_DN8563_c0_g1_i2.p1 TRINITY_DN8563_c0_g1~~TRINITY_DN8563_c0_g1_i2.p1  ORF type:complete len:366 (-),score=83.65 TRINITY_DN8563_c0_g1_i2:747-1844(-)